jgi:outer membrane protein assembly factor BamB
MVTDLENIVFVGFNKHVAALNRNTGELVWSWKAPKASGPYVSMLLVNECQLIVSAGGYTYCLDPMRGEQRWLNELKGFGTGVTSIVAMDRHNPHDPLVAAAADEATRSRSAAAASGG